MISNWATIIAGGALVGAVALERHHHQKLQKKYREEYRYLRVIPHEDTKGDVEKVMRLMQNMYEYKRTKLDKLAKGQEWFRFLIYKDIGGELQFFLGFPQDRQTGLKRSFNNSYPDIELIDVQREDVPCKMPELNDKEKTFYGGYFDYAFKNNRQGYAFKSYDGKEDLEDILYSLDAGQKGTQTWLDILITPVPNTEIQKLVKKSLNDIYTKYGLSDDTNKNMNIGDFKDALGNHNRPSSKKQTETKKKVSLSDLDPDEVERIKALKKRYTGRETAFNISIRLLSYSKHADSVVHTAATAVRSAYKMDNGLHFVKVKNFEKKVLDAVPLPTTTQMITLTGEELSNIFRLPRGDHRIYKFVPHLNRGQRLLGNDEFTEGISIGTMQHPAVKNRAVKISLAQYTRHWGLTGMTGAGKSSFLLEMIESIIQAWFTDEKRAPGFTLNDPAQETVATVLNRLCHYEKIGMPVDWSRVHYFSFNDPEYVLPLNILHRKNESVDDLADEVFDLIKAAYGGDTPQMDRILRNVLITLLSDQSQTHNLLGIIPLLTDERFRNRVLPNVEYNAAVGSFWESEFPDLAKNIQKAVGPLLNRLSPFQTNTQMRRMFGQPEMGLNIRKWMDDGHIILFDLKGVSNQTLKLAGGYTALQYHKTAQTRRTGSRVHIDIFDEAHRTQFAIMNKIFAEDRKFGLSLGLSTQNIGQLDPEIVNSLTEIVNNIFSSAQGYKSAAIVSRITSGAFSSHFLQNLPERTLAVLTKSKVDGKNQNTTFTVECAPPYIFKPDGSGDWANHEDDQEMGAAFEWGLDKGRELMKRDCLLSKDVDQTIHQYINTGTVMQTLKQQGSEANTLIAIPELKRPSQKQSTNRWQ